MPKMGRQRSIITHDNEKEFFKCVRRGETGKIRHFVDDQGIDINIRDAWGNSALYLACLCGHPRMVEILLQKGARYDAGSIEIQRCFLSALTQEIRDIMREYESSCLIEKHSNTMDFSYFLENLYELMPGYDIQLVVANQIYHAHKAVLFARCEYFRDRLTDGSQESTMVLTASQFTPTALRSLLQFIYTGRLDIQSDEELETRALATFLGYSELEEAISKETYTAVNKPENKRKKKAEIEVTVRYRNLFSQLQKDMMILSNGAVPLNLQIQLKQDDAIMQDKDYFCDICLSVEGYVFKCHKAFLCGRSEFFHSLLIDRQDEQPPAFEGYKPTIKLEGVAAPDFAQIISFIYTDGCQVTRVNFLSLLKLSELYALSGLKKKVMKPIHQLLLNTNVVTAYATAMETDNKKLVQECCKYMADNLRQMQSEPLFKDLLFRELGNSLDEKGREAGFATNATDHTVSSEFMDELLYYIRGSARTDSEISQANEKICLLNTLIERELGYSEKFSLIGTPVQKYPYKVEQKKPTTQIFMSAATAPTSSVATGTTQEPEQDVQRKKKKSDCTIQ